MKMSKQSIQRFENRIKPIEASEKVKGITLYFFRVKNQIHNRKEKY
ncbi:hypothetical protein PAE4_70071 [Bacillus altitudinis]|nr:hypothetical protein PAE4_70071 [Bacillus altitudinis]